MLKDFFHNSASEYLAAGSLYGLLIDNLGHGLHAKEFMISTSPKSGIDVFALWSLVASEKPDKNQNIQYKWREDVINLQNEPIGILGLPVGLYIDLFDSLLIINNFDIDEEESLRQALFPFVSAYSTALRRARSDNYHWSLMAMPFHPVEAEIMAVLIGVQRVLPYQTIQRVVSSMPIGNLAKLLIADVFRQYNKSALGHREANDES